MRRSPDGAIALSLIALVVSVPVGALVGTMVRDRPPALVAQRPAPPVVLPTAQVRLDGRRAVEVVFGWDEGAPLLSAGGGGTITSLDIASGSTLRTGTSIGTVDGERLVALVGPTPLHRDLVLGDRGPDVESVRHLLAAMGALGGRDADGDRVDARLVAAASSVGLVEVGAAGTPDGSDPEASPSVEARIVRSRIVWVGSEPVVLGTVDVALGGRWPEAGEPFARRPKRLRSAAIELGDRALPPGGGALVLAVADAVVPVAAGGRIEAAILPWVAAVVDADVERMEAELRFAEPTDAIAVPSSAIVIEGTTSCVLVRRGAGWTAATVDLLDAELGRTLVRPRGLDLEEVLANPQQVVTRPRCDS